MKISAVLEVPSVRILLLLLEKGELRHTELSKVIESRGTLSLSLKELDEDGLLKRRVVSSKPIQTYYSLSEKGRVIATKLLDISEDLVASR